ncbi:MAG TPA: formate/nitrite transporter family protein [Solirubrobacteraceae bacterium]|nr:formate/nitrite transporter family protein [Solirubrobacteraceae bacterium]
MSGRGPGEIWQASSDEGQRRVDRSFGGQVATGFVGGVDVMLGVTALALLSGALVLVMPEPTAHALGSFGLGIGLAFIVIGRSELFTENFLVPVTTVAARRRGMRSLVRLWALTLLGNLAGLLVIALVLTREDLVPTQTLVAASRLAETFAERDVVAALLSAIVAGAVMTLLTWLAHAAHDETAKIAIALVIGFVLAAPSLNHAVVSFGEMSFGILAGTGEAGWIDLAQNFPVAVVGNLLGGLGFVTVMRAFQVRGEPR